MIFKIVIKTPNQNDIQINSGNCQIRIYQSASDDFTRVQCITRPDLHLQVRSNIVSKFGLELNAAQILESDPVKDPNHWLSKTDEELNSYYKKIKNTASQRVRKHHVRHGSKAGTRRAK